MKHFHFLFYVYKKTLNGKCVLGTKYIAGYCNIYFIFFLRLNFLR